MAWKLSDSQAEALDKLRFSTVDATVFRNATIILMSGAGSSKPAIAKTLASARERSTIFARRIVNAGSTA